MPNPHPHTPHPTPPPPPPSLPPPTHTPPPHPHPTHTHTPPPPCSTYFAHHAYFKLKLDPQAIDNPDQRICEDVRAFCSTSVGLTVSIARKAVNCVAFAGARAGPARAPGAARRRGLRGAGGRAWARATRSACEPRVSAA